MEFRRVLFRSNAGSKTTPLEWGKGVDPLACSHRSEPELAHGAATDLLHGGTLQRNQVKVSISGWDAYETGGPNTAAATPQPAEATRATTTLQATSLL